jgi:nickel transport protein
MIPRFYNRRKINLQDMFMKRLLTGLALTWLCGFAALPAAHAHKVTVFAWAEGDRIFTESKFSGGKMVKAGKVEVFDSDGNLLLEGRTDDNGAFAFKAPAITDLKIVLTAGMGHQNSWLISAAELGEGEIAPVATHETPSEPAAVDIQGEKVPPVAGPGVTAREIEAIVSRQLEQKIKPLTRMVAASQEKGPTMSDILGGIGYIIGLVGLGAYIRYRKDSRSS